MRRTLGLIVAVGLLALAGCRGRGDAPAEPQVSAAFYPLQFVAEQVAGAAADVTGVTPAGVEPHDIELTARQIVNLTGADLLIFVGEGFQPALDNLLPELKGATIDALKVNPTISRAGDPHIWLDPVAMVSLTRAVEEALVELDPDQAEGYRERAGALIARLNRLDDRFQQGLTLCARREIVTSHAAFGYMTDRYHLEQISVGGVDPEQEQSPQRLAEVARLVEEHDVTTIFFERLIPPDVAETIASETGAGTAQLDPLESPPATGDYISAMDANLAALRAALGCR